MKTNELTCQHLVQFRMENFYGIIWNDSVVVFADSVSDDPFGTLSYHANLQLKTRFRDDLTSSISVWDIQAVWVAPKVAMNLPDCRNYMKNTEPIWEGN